ncbi:MAG: hypothetical protein ACLFWD_13170, partial [Anaerolineales bacterium]
ADLLDVEVERERIKEEMEVIQAQIDRLEKQLAGPFSERAPEQVVQKERDKLADYRQSMEKLEPQLKALG